MRARWAGLGLVAICTGCGGTELTTIALGEDPGKGTIEVEEDALWLGYNLAAHIDCEGPYCTKPSSSMPHKLQPWQPTFDVAVDVAQGDEVVARSVCNTDQYGLVESDRYRWDPQTFVGKFTAKAKLEECAVELPAPGTYEVRAKLVAKPGEELLGWHLIPGGTVFKEDARAKFSDVELIPTAYAKEGWSGNKPK